MPFLNNLIKTSAFTKYKDNSKKNCTMLCVYISKLHLLLFELYFFIVNASATKKLRIY